MSAGELGFPAAPIEGWLAERLGASKVSITGHRRPSSGFSADTIFLDLSVDGDDRRVVMRVQSDQPPIYPVQVPKGPIEIEIQYRIMHALGQAATVPIAEMIGFEPDRSLIGHEFFVMGFRGGVVPIESPPYTKEGFFLDATPEARTSLIRNGLSQLAKVHQLDWRDAGLEWLTPGNVMPNAAHQLNVWERYMRNELRGREHPLFEEALAWLRNHPALESPAGLCWGDPRPGNVIWNEQSGSYVPICLTDFEAASIAPPEIDLGWWLMFDRTMHECCGITERLPGDPTREAQRAMYEAAIGRTVGDTLYWEIHAATRYTAIVVRVMNRAVDLGHMPATHTIWLTNPATQALEQLLALR